MSTEITTNPSQQQNPPPTKILVIDDDAAIREVMYNYLASQGYSPLLAEEGEAGLEIFATESPDLVLLDLRLPGMDGLEVLSQLVKMPLIFPSLSFQGRELSKMLPIL